MNKDRKIIKDNDLDNVHGGTKSPPLKDDAGKERGLDNSPLSSVYKKKEKDDKTSNYVPF